jgi:hypothetical protein
MVALGTVVGLTPLAKIDLSAVERLVWVTALGLRVVLLVGLGFGVMRPLQP